MNTAPLSYYMHDGPTAFRFELAGHLNEEGARRLDQDWRTARSTLGDRRLNIDMTFVTAVDEQGGALIRRWQREGACFIARSRASRALAEATLGEVLSEPWQAADAAIVSVRSWFPNRASFSARGVTIALLATMVFPAEANAVSGNFRKCTAAFGTPHAVDSADSGGNQGSAGRTKEQ